MKAHHTVFGRYHTDISKTITNNDPSEQVPLNEVAEECGCRAEWQLMIAKSM